MRATVLCILAFAGATCALQIPSIPSPQSALNAGSSILGNIPGIKGGDGSSSSSSSSEEDQKPSDIATEMAERLVDDIVNAAGGIGSIAMLPINIGTSVFDTVAKDIRNFLGDVLHPENLNPDGPTVPELAVDLARSVVRDVEKLARNAGSLLLQPVRFKAQLVETIARGVDNFLKNVQNQISGDSSEQHRPRPDHHNPHHRPSSTHPPKPTSGRPSSTHPPKPTSSHGPTHPSRPSTERPRPTHPSRPSTERPRPTHPSRPSTEGPRPTHPSRPSTERPRPTHPSRPSTEGPRPTHPSRPSTEGPQTTTPKFISTPPIPVRNASNDDIHVRVARDIDFSFSTGIIVDQVLKDGKVRHLGEALASVNFSAITEPIPKISDLTPLNKLPSLPELASATRRARNLVIHAIAAGASTIEEAIQTALSAAIRSVNPSKAIVNLVNIIVQMYVFVAQSALIIPPVAAALLKEAAIVVGSIVSSLLAVMSDKVADGVRALLN